MSLSISVKIPRALHLNLHQFLCDIIVSGQIDDVLETANYCLTCIIRSQFKYIKELLAHNVTVRQMIDKFQLSQYQFDFHVRNRSAKFANIFSFRFKSNFELLVNFTYSCTDSDFTLFNKISMMSACKKSTIRKSFIMLSCDCLVTSEFGKFICWRNKVKKTILNSC